ncbi:MAG TPA: alginate export family protein, partial [Rubrivivax sp.]|nr:alginate export family protein [Rubrivivax sp.]
WSEHAWRPKLTVGLQSLSGDNPDTPRLERFDPLFYEGSPGAWASGSKASMVFINSNVRALQARLELQPSPRDIVTVYVAHLRAEYLRSPLQFGQATRVDIANGVSAVVAGVTHPHLADDVFVKYTRIVNRHTYLTAGYSASFPGEAVKRLLGGRSPVWSGWLVNLVLTY